MPALLPTAPFPPFKSGISNLKFLIPLALTLLLGAVATASAEESPKQEHDEAMARYEQAWRDNQDLDALWKLALLKLSTQDLSGLEPFLDDMLAQQTAPDIQMLLGAYSVMVDDKEKGSRIFEEASRNLSKHSAKEIKDLKDLLVKASLRIEQSSKSSDAPVVRYRDPGLGITFEHSADFEPIQFTPPEFSYDLAASMREAGIDWHIVGLVEKRLSRNLDPETLRSGQVPAILLDRHPAFPPTDDDPSGLLEACLTRLTPQRIGNCDAYELPGYPGPYGEKAFCWVVPLPATRRELPPEEGVTEPVSVPIPAGWLLISAPRHFDPDDNDDPKIRHYLETISPLLSPHEKSPTGYDREIRRILETLTPL